MGLPRWFLNFLFARRKKRFTREFAGAIDVIVRSVRSGLPTNEALRIVARETPDPVGSEFTRLVDGLKVGVTLEQGLKKMHENIPTAEVGFFGIVMTIQAKSGGNLSEALSNLAFVLRDRKRLEGKIKAMSYGLAYGLSAFGLSQQLGISPDEARRLMEEYFGRFGGVRDYLADVVERARIDGHTATMLGRRRYLPDLTSDNRQRREMAERMALNAPIQDGESASSDRQDFLVDGAPLQDELVQDEIDTGRWSGWLHDAMSTLSPREARILLAVASMSGALSSSVPSRSNRAARGNPADVTASPRRPGSSRRCAYSAVRAAATARRPGRTRPAVAALHRAATRPVPTDG